jgi:prephenate dehydratase
MNREPQILGEQVLTVAIQGERGSNHHVAAEQFFGPGIRLDAQGSVPALVRAMEQDPARAGLMAIENSLAGALLPNYALLRGAPLAIVGEVYLRISHCLMALPGQQLSEIREVHSHPMALLQCDAFLDRHPHLRLVENPDTAGAARWIAEEGLRGMAAIASEAAAAIYGLELLASGIETNPRNFTRFLVLAHRERAAAFALSPDKASLCFHLSHEVGNLAQVLLILSSHGMNLTKIQSLPLVGREWEYFFHIDLEYDEHAQYQRALAAIRPRVQALQVLGEYARGEKPSA